MAYLLASIPYFRVLVRREYLRDLEDGHGEYAHGTAIAVHCVKGDSLHFQVVLHEPLAGCAFLLPIEALTTKPCEPVGARTTQPWDCFSSDFGVCELAAVRRGAVRLKDGRHAEYRCTLAFTGTDLADDPAQRKFLHIVLHEDGPVVAVPNNRMVFIDRALFGDFTAKPDFKTLTQEFRAEGLQRWVGSAPKPNGHMLPPAHHSDPAERPDWQRPLA